MLIERVTAETSLGKVYIVAADGMVVKTFSECESVTAQADANEYIQEYLLNSTRSGCACRVRYN